MKRNTARILLTCVACLVLAGAAWAGGFSIYEAGARATAMGGAFTATADDGSAMFYNPAGLAFLSGSALDLNVMPVIPKSKFTSAVGPDGDYSTGETADNVYPIPGTYFYHNNGDFTWGVGVYAPFGLGVEWKDKDNWIGRRYSYDVYLSTIYVTPTVAWQLSDKVGFAMGIDAAFTHINYKKRQAIRFGGNADLVDVIDAEIDADSDLNFTPTAGLMVKATDRLTFGVMYHHEKNMAIRDGDLTLTNVAPAALRSTVDGQIAALGGTHHKGKADLRLPHIWSMGVAYQVTPQLRTEFDAVHFGWHTFNELDLDFDGTALDQNILEGYDDAWQYRFGASYDLNARLTMMAGYVRDDTPQPVESMTPMLPDGDRNDYSLGIAWQASPRLTVTATYMGVDFDERSNVIDGVHRSYDLETSPAGTYDSSADILGLGFGYRF